jgi:hypothetical protein
MGFVCAQIIVNFTCFINRHTVPYFFNVNLLEKNIKNVIRNRMTGIPPLYEDKYGYRVRMSIGGKIYQWRFKLMSDAVYYYNELIAI